MLQYLKEQHQMKEARSPTTRMSIAEPSEARERTRSPHPPTNNPLGGAEFAGRIADLPRAPPKAPQNVTTAVKGSGALPNIPRPKVSPPTCSLSNPCVPRECPQLGGKAVTYFEMCREFIALGGRKLDVPNCQAGEAPRAKAPKLSSFHDKFPGSILT